MDKEYWLGKWQANDIAFHEDNVNPDLVAYVDELSLQPGDYILVPLCGKSMDMLWLAEKGFNVVGVEISSIACDDFFTAINAVPQIVKHDKLIKYQYNNIELICGDFFDLTSADFPRINAVYDCKALIALPPDLRKKYLNHLIDMLGSQLKYLLLTRESDCNVNPPPFPVNKEEVYSLYGTHFNIKQLKHLSVLKIPGRLIKKGYTQMIEGVYLMSGKK